MADRHLRGARVGGSSLQREDGITLAERQSIIYLCPQCGEETTLIFAKEADVPASWQCRGCGGKALRPGVDAELETEPDEPLSGGRTPWEMLRERRTIPELEEILQERLDWLRSRRGEIDEP